MALEWHRLPYGGAVARTRFAHIRVTTDARGAVRSTDVRWQVRITALDTSPLAHTDGLATAKEARAWANDTYAALLHQEFVLVTAAE